MTKEELKNTNPDSILLIDIREEGEVANLPCPKNAVHIAMSHITEAVLEGKLPRDKKLITICHSGGRCLTVNEYLKSNGYEADYLEGGMMSLRN
jgi:rhodanese-related sulfurtransferase